MKQRPNVAREAIWIGLVILGVLVVIGLYALLHDYAIDLPHGVGGP